MPLTEQQRQALLRNTDLLRKALNSDGRAYVESCARAKEDPRAALQKLPLSKFEAYINEKNLAPNQATRPTAVQKSSQIPAQIGHYQILEELGRGAMGVVYKARAPSLDQLYAIKVMQHPDLERDERFVREGRSMARLNHPAILSVHAADRHQGQPYLVMDFVEGGRTLETLIKNHKLTPTTIAEILLSVAQGLNHAHEQGIVHRDLKPENILITPQGTPLIADFGLAKKLDEESQELTQSGILVGTPLYMAPEQINGQNNLVTHRSDIYAAGVILYRSLTGKLPFVGQTIVDLVKQVVDQNLSAPPPRTINAEIPRDLEIICLKAMTKNPAKRYQTAQELADDLERYLNSEPIHARAENLFEKAKRTVRKNPLRTAIAAITLGGLVFASAISAHYTSKERAEAWTQLQQYVAEKDWKNATRQLERVRILDPNSQNLGLLEKKIQGDSTVQIKAPPTTRYTIQNVTSGQTIVTDPSTNTLLLPEGAYVINVKPAQSAAYSDTFTVKRDCDFTLQTYQAPQIDGFIFIPPGPSRVGLGEEEKKVDLQRFYIQQRHITVEQYYVDYLSRKLGIGPSEARDGYTPQLTQQGRPPVPLTHAALKANNITDQHPAICLTPAMLDAYAKSQTICGRTPHVPTEAEMRRVIGELSGSTFVDGMTFNPRSAGIKGTVERSNTPFFQLVLKEPGTGQERVRRSVFGVEFGSLSDICHGTQPTEIDWAIGGSYKDEHTALHRITPPYARSMTSHSSAPNIGGRVALPYTPE